MTKDTVIAPFQRTMEVKDSKCSCVSGSLGYCDHSVAIMLKAFSLYGSKNAYDLQNEADQIPEQACTSKLQTWRQKGRGETIFPQPEMDVVVSKPKLEDTKRGNEGIRSLLYEARKIQCTAVQRSKTSSRQSDWYKPSNGSCSNSQHIWKKRYSGIVSYSPVGSHVSYQLTHTESNSHVCVNISSVPRGRKNNQPLTYRRFPLRDHEPPTFQNNQLTDVEKNSYESLSIDEGD